MSAQHLAWVKSPKSAASARLAAHQAAQGRADKYVPQAALLRAITRVGRRKDAAFGRGGLMKVSAMLSPMLRPVFLGSTNPSFV